jgi:NAD+ synthase (glutamine-hydrolysing)
VKVALAQFSPHLGDLGKNLDFHLRTIDKVRRKKARLVVFPELSLTGYTLMDLVPEAALDPARHPAFKRLAAESRTIDIVLGFVEEGEKGLYYNSAAYLSGGRVVHIHRKAFLPTGGMFEEAKFFATGRSFRTFTTPLGKTGLMVCRDFLNYGAGYSLFTGGADVIIVISAAPGRGLTEGDAFASSRMWELMGEAVAFFSTTFVVYCNRVGFEDGKTFAGGSFIFEPTGRRLVKAPEAEEELVLADLRLEDIRSARKKWTFLRDNRPEVVIRSLKGIADGDED